jgi:precorrin-3B synthase
MSAPAILRRGWCPGALRPMLTGDGLLLRVRVPCGRLSLDQALSIADCAARHGNGTIEITARANLQLRGVRNASLFALQKRLHSLGLLDADEATESARNILVSPIADLDPTAILDPEPLARALDARLESDAALRSLPPKFSFTIDGGGALSLAGISSDIRFVAARVPNGLAFEIFLDGDDSVAALCQPIDVAAAAGRIARIFERLTARAGADARRMAQVTRKIGASSLFAKASLAPVAPSAIARGPASLETFLGAHRFGEEFCVGAAPALGRMRAEDLAFLAQSVRRLGARDIRVTPWRALIVTGLAAVSSRALVGELTSSRFILDPTDPLLRIVACAGAPACGNAARDVQAEAKDFAREVLKERGIFLHVSGCSKGCAHAAPAPLTLVARPTGYDLVSNGRAADAPQRVDLSLADVAMLLARERADHEI